MRNGFMHFVYIFLFSLLVATAIFQYEAKGSSVIWLSLALAVLYLVPEFTERIFGIVIPPLLKFMIIAFLFLCLQVGGMLSFFTRFDGWDSFVHLVSGFLTPVIGLSAINFLNRDPISIKKLSPVFIFVFLVLFACGISLLWEYAELLSDTVFGTNHINDTVLNDGTTDIGLIDTMTDLLFSQASSLLTSFLLYRAVKSKNWTAISKFLVSRVKR